LGKAGFIKIRQFGHSASAGSAPSDGHDTTEAVQLLGTFIDLQHAHEQDRARIMRELAELES
jgi:hypothetical protein